MIGKIKKILPFAVMGVIFYYFMTRVEWEATLATLSQVSYLNFSFAVLANVLAAVGMSTVHYRFATNQSGCSSLGYVESINSKVLGYSTVFPTAVVAAYKISGFNKIFGSTAKSVAFFLVGKICSLVVAGIVVVVVAYTGINGIEGAIDQSRLRSFLIVGIVFFAALLILSNVKVFRNSLIRPILERLPQRLLQALKNGAAVFGWRAWLSGVATQSIAFVLSAGAGVLLAFSINANFPFEAVILGRAVTLIALLAPISVAGVGAREVSYLAILPLYSVSPSDSAALVLLLLLTQWGAGALSFVYAMFLDRMIARGSE